MHYYQFNIGDYARDTSHLSVIEHGIYRLLLDWCYLNEKPIPTDKALRIGRGHPDETQSVLSEFFSLSEDGWQHNRVAAEVSKYRKKAETNRKNGVKGGRPITEKNPAGSQSEPNRNPNQEPITNNQKKDYGANAPLSSPPKNDGENAESVAGKTHLPPCPIDEIVSEYHNRLPSLPRVLVRNAKRDGLIRGRWREAFADGKFTDRADGMGLFCEFFDHVSGSRFLTGRADSKPGVPPFCADLEWLMRPTNWAKVVEGKYHR
jgi:uncharacterized protein YdaU (DUF1376 family)